MRHAADVGREATIITAVDPQPRTGIDAAADRVIRQRMEETDLTAETDTLAAGDVVFVDSSHEVDTGNDVIQVLLRVVPTLAPGVLVHVHDVFLPYEYPRQWLLDFDWRWNEQYLLHALLADSPRYRVIWPGYALWRTRQELIRDLPGYDGRAPQSFWFEVADAV
jgi:hypothetical protein